MGKKLSEEDLINIFKHYQIEKNKVATARDFIYEYFLPIFDELPFTKILRDRDLRMDAYIEAIERFVNVLKGETGAVYEYRKEIGMKPYFCTIFNGKCRDILRKETAKKESKEISVEDSFLENLTAMSLIKILPLIKQNLDNPVMWERLYAFKQKFGHCFDIILLRYVEGFTIDEIATILKKKYGTVKTQSSTCMDKLITFFRIP